MRITRDVILDLLAVYMSGEASPATRSLVDEYLSQDPELAQRVRARHAEALPKLAPPLLPEMELRSLHRTRRMLTSLRWLCALATTFTALSLTSAVSFHDGRIQRFRLLIFDYPLAFGTCLGLGILAWVAYFTLRRRSRTDLL